MFKLSAEEGLLDWPEEITKPLYNLFSNQKDEELEQVKSEMDQMLNKVRSIGFNNLDDFAEYYGFSSLGDVKKHLLGCY